MTDQKQYNELAARLQRLETLMQNNDAYQNPGAVTLAEMNLGPGLDFSIPDMDYGGNLQWDNAWNPDEYSNWQDQQEEFNQGFAESEATINELLSRLNAVETFLSGGSNDTAQSDALDWGAETGDDGQTGTGDTTGVPAGFTQVSISICDSGTPKTMTVIGTVPV